MNNCPHAEIETALDRWQESHWHLHQMEAHYHDPGPFRYSLNSFIRSVKEVPVMLMNDLQHHGQARVTIRPALSELNSNELFSILKKRRDFIVHHGSLELESHGSVRTVEGSRVKMSLPFPVAPHERSDDAYERYKQACRADKVWRSLSGPDCDSVPTIWRTWRVPQFPMRDLLDVAVDSWTLVGKLLSSAVVALKGDALDLTLPCRHNPEEVRTKRYSQREFFLSVDGIDLVEEEKKWKARRAAEKNKDGLG